MGKQDPRRSTALGSPRDLALNACIETALRTAGRPLSIHDYARATGVSARMLIHYFGTRAGLDGAVIRAVDDALRAQAETLAQTLGGLNAIEDLVLGFRSPESAQVRRLFRTLLARAFDGDPLAVALLVEERERWTALFERSLKTRADASKTVVLLLGAAMDAILDDMSSERAPSKHRSRSRLTPSQRQKKRAVRE
jgi:AcrR family transcriptional regulator